MFSKLCIAYILVRIFFQFFPNNYLSELGISFLPYMIISDLIAVCVILFFSIRNRKNTRKFILRTIILLSQIILTLFATNKVANFYIQWAELTTKESSKEKKLSFLVANILKTNTDYEGIKKMITDTDPDVVMLIEYESGHQAHLQDFFAEYYPYKNREIYDTDYFGNMIYSKYPLTNLAPTVEQISRRYGYASINKGGEEYVFYLIHTSAPVSYDYYLQRNKQLDYMAETFLEQQVTRDPDTMVIMAGDFNLSPRSPYYTKFYDNIKGYLSNVSASIPLATSRKVLNVPFLQVHIDHVFSNQPKNFDSIERIEVPGSDHFGFYATIEF